MTSTRTQSIILEPRAGQPIAHFANRALFKVTGDDTGGKYAVMEFDLAPRAEGPPLHRHERTDEMYYVLEGTAGFRIDDRQFEAGPGGFAFIERGTAHTIFNPTDRTTRLLIQMSPAGFEGFFFEAAEIIEAIGGQPDPEVVGRLMSRHDVIPAEQPAH